MANSNPAFKFDSEQGKRASVIANKAKRAELRLRKKALNIEQEAQFMRLLEAGMKSPVIAGTIAFFVVSAVEAGTNVVKGLNGEDTSTDKKATGKNLITWIEGNFNPLAGTENLITALQGLDFTALKAAIIAYIASGGNLAGLLTSVGGTATSVISALGLGTSA